jgi:hypothetical protein
MYQGWLEEPLVAPEPPFTGAAVPEPALVVVWLEPVAVVCEVPFEHNPKNQDWIPAKPFGSVGQAASQTPVVPV